MKRILRILGLSMILAALIVVSITGAVFAHNGHGDGEGTPNTECSGPYEPGPYGPHGAQNGIVSE